MVFALVAFLRACASFCSALNFFLLLQNARGQSIFLIMLVHALRQSKTTERRLFLFNFHTVQNCDWKTNLFCSDFLLASSFCCSRIAVCSSCNRTAALKNKFFRCEKSFLSNKVHCQNVVFEGIRLLRPRISSKIKPVFTFSFLPSLCPRPPFLV